MKTLILLSSTGKTRFVVMSMVKATNLIELGIDIYGYHSRRKQKADLFVDLVKCNPKLKSLNMPVDATEILLASVFGNSQFEYHFEELSFHFARMQNNCDAVLDFVETHKETLKSLRLVNCVIQGNNAVELLSLNLNRLKLRHFLMNFPQNAVHHNTSIESLAFIRFIERTNSTIESLCNFMDCCVNLAAFIPNRDTVYPEAVKSWKFIDTWRYYAKRLSWSDLRSLRYAGVADTAEYIGNPRYRYYQGRLKEVSDETHSYLKIRWKFCWRLATIKAYVDIFLFLFMGTFHASQKLYALLRKLFTRILFP